MLPIKLSRANLSSLVPTVATPTYDVENISAGIVHLGFGGFHRAHMARYTHDLMGSTRDHGDWGIVGVGLLDGDRHMRDALLPQDCLYTLVERTATQDTASVIGSVCGVLHAQDNRAQLFDALDDARVRIVSLTVTENGYCMDRASGALDVDNPAIRHDIASPTEPVSAPGIIVQAAKRRMLARQPGFTALSCDNVQHNGHVLAGSVLALARLSSPDVVAWVEDNIHFPGTMVDRITPVTTSDDLLILRDEFGVDDAWPVFCESFRQWVIEDDFIRGRPAWEHVGAQFVKDVAPYEFMKLRLLNASHLAVAGLGQLSGYEFMAEAMADKKISAFMRALMDRETGQTLRPVPGIDLTLYKKTLIERFSNPKIRDTTQRVNTDAPLATLLDSARDRLKDDQSIDLLALAIAAWIKRVAGENDHGQPLDIRHPLAAPLRDKAREGRRDPGPVIGIRPLFGNLADDTRFVAPVSRWLERLYDLGTQGTLERALAEGSF
ncbi:mannitol-1-phosphate/altronate dehydrogenase [Ameyamaea chiangmaiensis NBRC 103196]|uniref:Mannitol dehydrogenase family protein n=1 Tax=Ameyamaea chiangmaiensis TaxID=442969 RepID=A0A850P5U1_9PROT|nr:mannitol dehydrogenase family protein [Ameyamaea chiangmaiensis]MBS4075831.1 mannitol dehydrogenase family protein [Ameyamaea chiangmaiensis]NVN39298.1 mannitol dehydrogenase family protein [Ameyamaea chiangmaiensis]GBQ63910.1 mannitol-1-phosphate/altronate dehydrogenase [Ameyamaea chiangmaiensis NBRC 103196]